MVRRRRPRPDRCGWRDPRARGPDPAQDRGAVQHAIDRHAGRATAWKPFFSPGIPLGIVAVAISLVAWSLARGWWHVAAALASVPLAIVVAELMLKPLVDHVEHGG